ncbi:MAG: FHA domain-containing protein, partial [Myxococcota bacterium]|nr:FHA domain-containing protein [Myxococcota bacterium]
MTSVTRFVVGGGADCDVILAQRTISSHHAECTWDGQAWSIRDLGSTNGTSVDGRPVGERPEAITLGHTVAFGSRLYPFDQLVVLATAGHFDRHWTLGANPDNDHVTDAGPVSGVHARIYRCGAVYYIVDLASTNGTSVDGRALEGHPVEVHRGSRVQLGSHDLALDFVFPPTAAPVRIPSGAYIIGASLYCAAHIDQGQVSSKHALLRVEGDRLTLHDLDSTNGTRVDGVALGDDPVEITSRTQLSLGSHPMSGAGLLAMLAQAKPTRIVGAHPGCDWVITDPKASGVHLAVLAHQSGFLLVDMGSSNGVWVDGERVQRTPLNRRATVTIGDTVIAASDLVERLGFAWPEAPVEPASEEVAASSDPASAAPSPKETAGREPEGSGGSGGRDRGSPPSGPSGTGGASPPPSSGGPWGALVFAALLAMAAVGVFYFVDQQETSRVDLDDDETEPR